MTTHPTRRSTGSQPGEEPTQAVAKATLERWMNAAGNDERVAWEQLMTRLARRHPHMHPGRGERRPGRPRIFGQNNGVS